MNRLPPYPAYKPAGVPWLQQVPEHWSSARAKSLFQKVERPVRPEDETVTCFRDGTVTLRKNRRATGYTESLKEIGYQGVRKGDLVIHVMDAFAGSMGVSDSDGKSTPVYSVCVPRGSEVPWYFAYQLRQMARAGWLQALSKGIRERSSDFRFELFGMQTMLVPPPDEQHLIVRYLRALDAKVKRYIRTKRKLIAALQEQKQAIIQRAVTRGLDPKRSPGAPSGVKLKPSGVEWLGEVPEHWEVRPAKYIFREIDERSKTGREELLSVSHITGVTPRSLKEVTMFMAKTYAGHKVCREGDLVINTMWAWAGALGVSQHTGLVSPAYAVYRPIAKLHHDSYLDLLLRTNSYKDQFFCESTGLRKSRLRMYPEKFFRVGIPCPSLDEQQAILVYLSSATRSLEQTLQKAQQEVAVMQEYHTRLIADVVTGAVDVREAAGKLPLVDQRIGRSNDQMMEPTFAEASADEEEPLSVAAEGDAEYGEEEV